MLKSRTRVLLTLVGAGLAAATLAPTASAAEQRYAIPTGSGTDCTAVHPCGLRQAVEGVDPTSLENEVIVAPGQYWLSATLAISYKTTVHGVEGKPRPRLVFSGTGQGGAGQEGLKVKAGSTLRYVEVDQVQADRPALSAFDSAVDQVIATASGAGMTAAIWDSTIRNSIVVASGTNGIALQTTSNPAPNTSTYRNVTAIATGSGGVAIRARASSAGNASIQARNVIARGGPGGHSVQAFTDGSGASASITVSHSNRADESTFGTNTSIVNGGGNQTAAPLFVNAAAGDYRQAPGSPTINAGLDEVINGAFDVDGDPRQIGSTDIGADEFLGAPAVSTGPAGGVTMQSAELSGSVNPNGVPSSYRFEYGPTAAYGSTTSTTSAGNAGTVAAGATIGGLSPATTYHYRIVATNAGGVTQGADRTFTTSSPAAPPPITQPPATPPAPPPTSASFAGVRLASTRLSFARTSVVLTLRCPAATAGSCSGRTTLTARRRPGTRAASTVTLGRATFSIAAGKQAKVRVRVSRAGRRLLNQTGRLRGRASNAARDGAGQTKTTVAAVTIRRHR